MDDSTPLSEIKTFLQEHFVEGVSCPACGRLVKKYERPITSSSVLVLFLLFHHYYENGDTWVHVPTLIERSKYDPHTRASIRGDWAKMRFYGLIVGKEEERSDGSSRNGYWKITDLGCRFLQRKAKVPKFFYVFNKHTFGSSPELVDVDECLQEKFNYDKLMGLKL